MYTTLNMIRDCHPCRDGWTTLLEFLDKTGPDDDRLSLLTILESNGFEDAVWCLRAVPGYEFDREKRLFAVKCARRVQRLLDDQRSFNALDVSEAYANGLASAKELRKACEDAWAASGSTTWAIAWAKRAATGAASEQAWEAAWQATGATMCAVESDARWGQGAAACDAAYAAEREFQASLFVEMFSPIQEEK